MPNDGKSKWLMSFALIGHLIWLYLVPSYPSVQDAKTLL